MIYLREKEFRVFLETHELTQKAFADKAGLTKNVLCSCLAHRRATGNIVRKKIINAIESILGRKIEPAEYFMIDC